MTVSTKPNQQINSSFLSVKNPSGLKDWLLKNYFNPEKHGKEIYFSKNVNKDNIFQYISDPKNNFPQTPNAIVELWGFLPDLQKSIRTITLFGKEDNVDAKKQINVRAEHTLRHIGSKIGNLTTTMVDKISEQAQARYTSLMEKLNKDAKTSKLTTELIENARLEAAEQITDCIFESSDYGDFSRRLLMKKVLHKPDLNYVDELEKASIQYLISVVKAFDDERDEEESLQQSEIEDIFLEDIKKEINVFNIMQMAVSRKVFSSI